MRYLNADFIKNCSGSLGLRGGGGTPSFGLYGYVPLDRVCFFWLFLASLS